MATSALTVPPWTLGVSSSQAPPISVSDSVQAVPCGTLDNVTVSFGEMANVAVSVLESSIEEMSPLVLDVSATSSNAELPNPAASESDRVIGNCPTRAFVSFRTDMEAVSAHWAYSVFTCPCPAANATPSPGA